MSLIGVASSGADTSGSAAAMQLFLVNGRCLRGTIILSEVDLLGEG